jgi:hypothetical protein
MNLLGGNMGTINKNIETLIASMEVGLEVNIRKKLSLVGILLPGCRSKSGHESNRSFENVSQLNYLGMTVTEQNLIQEEIKRRLNSGIACYHSVQNLLFLVCWPKMHKLNIQDHILPVVIYGCEICFLSLRENID